MPKLTDSEWAVLDVLWAHGPLALGPVVDALKEAGVELSFERPERPDRPEKPAKADDSEEVKDNAASSEAAAATQPTEPEKNGFFDGFTGWLSGLLG